MKKIFILLIVLLGLLVVSCGKKWDYEITKKESIQIGNDITFYLLTLKEKESGNELDALQITDEGFNKYNVGDKLTKEELDKLSTCDLNAKIDNGLSEASKEQLKYKTGEEIVNENLVNQGFDKNE